MIYATYRQILKSYICNPFETLVGDLTNVVIPRPDPNGQQVRGLGKVRINYAFKNL